MRISDWSSDVCSSDLSLRQGSRRGPRKRAARHRHPESPVSHRSLPLYPSASAGRRIDRRCARPRVPVYSSEPLLEADEEEAPARIEGQIVEAVGVIALEERSEEHTSELQSLMRSSYAVFCLKKNK